MAVGFRLGISVTYRVLSAVRCFDLGAAEAAGVAHSLLRAGQGDFAVSSWMEDENANDWEVSK